MKAWMWAVGLLAAAGPAMADPRLDEKVYTPYVQNHVFELEANVGQELGDGDLKGARTFVLEGEYGLNDRVSLAVLGQVEREPGEGDRLTGVGLESVIYVGQIPRVGVDTAVYLEFRKGVNGESDVAEGKLLFAKTAGRFQGLLNLIVERPLNGPAGEDIASYGYAASATWQAIGPLRLGVEAFGDLGDDHNVLRGPLGAYVGPQVKWEGRPKGSPFDIGVDAGWLVPVGPARAEAGSQFRLNVEFERAF